MEKNIDFRKLLREFYLPPARPHIVDVPRMTFIALDGSGAPEGEDYQNALSILYTLSYAIRMSYKSGNGPAGFFKYTVAPLEGIWKRAVGSDPGDRTAWQWTSMIMQPGFVDGGLFEWALERGAAKHKELDFSQAKLMEYREGRCVQMMHRGPYNSEDETFAVMEAFMRENGLVKSEEPGFASSHHEIYLNDPRRTAPDKLNTVLRLKITG